MGNIFYYTRLLWVKLMHIGSMLGCHQLPNRSFSFRQYQFPVCARCCGTLIGEISAIIAFVKRKRTPIIVSIICAIIMFIDWFVQYIGVKESNNHRRFITGIIGGFGCWSAELSIISLLFKGDNHRTNYGHKID